MLYSYRSLFSDTIFYLFAFTIFITLVPCRTLQAESAQRNPLNQIYLHSLIDNLYLYRDIPENLQYAQRIAVRALQRDPELQGIYWRLARNGWALSEKEGSSKKRIQILKTSIEHGKRALAKNPDSIQAHLWYAISLGKLMLEKGIMQTMMYKNEVRAELEHVLKKDPENDLALMGLSLWYFHLPSIMGGNQETAFKLINKAMKIDPSFSRIYLIKARMLIKTGQTQRAYSILQTILKMKTASVEANLVEDQLSARKLLNSLI